MASRTWWRVDSRGIRFGGSVGNLLRLGASDGTGGLRISASAGGRRGRAGVSHPVGGSKRRRNVWYGWLR